MFLRIAPPAVQKHACETHKFQIQVWLPDRATSVQLQSDIQTCQTHVSKHASSAMAFHPNMSNKSLQPFPDCMHFITNMLGSSAMALQPHMTHTHTPMLQSKALPIQLQTGLGFGCSAKAFQPNMRHETCCTTLRCSPFVLYQGCYAATAATAGVQ